MDLGAAIVCVTPSLLSIINFNVPLPYIFRSTAMPLHSCPSDVLYVMKWSLLGDMQPDAKFSMLIKKDLVLNRTMRGRSSASLTVPAKAWNIDVVHWRRTKNR